MNNLARRSVVAVLLLALAGGACPAQQAGEQVRMAELTYKSEMAHEGNDCPDAISLTDRNECLTNVRTGTYKNFDLFFRALREVVIDNSPNDANALALDRGESAWEKYRVATCDAMVDLYDIGTIKRPGSTEPSAQTRCLIQLTRSRMRDLMELYQPTF